MTCDCCGKREYTTQPYGTADVCAACAIPFSLGVRKASVKPFAVWVAEFICSIRAL